MQIRRQLVFLIACAALGGAGCERSAGPSGKRAPERSPRATIERLIAARHQSRYQSFNELTTPGRGPDLISTLMAVDEFLSANTLLCDYVRDRFAPGLSQSIDQSHWGAQLDVFSRYVNLISERIDGDTAYVAFTVDERIPVRRARLVLVEGEWRYDPGEGYDPQLPAAFQKMAKGLRQVLEDLQGGRLSDEEIRDNPERLLDEVRLRLSPGIKLLPKPETEESGDGDRP